MTEKAEQLRELIFKVFDNLECDGGSGTTLKFPDFDLMPYDYLEFAEKYLESQDNEHKLICVTHLKRAVECEIDTFLHVLGISRAIRNKNISFEQKLNFIGAVDIFNSRALIKLNRIRNKIEHEYAIPDIKDIELYYELAYAFVAVLEGFLSIHALHEEVEWSKKHLGPIVLKVKYDSNVPRVAYYIVIDGYKNNLEFDLSSIKELDNFAYALKVYFWLCKSLSIVNDSFVLQKINKISQL